MGLLNKLWQQWYQKHGDANDMPLMADEAFHHAPHFVRGERLLVESERTIDVINPRNGRPERRVYVATTAVLQQAMNSAQEARFEWGNTAYLQRLLVIEQFKNAFVLQQPALSEVLQQERGLSADEVGVEIAQTVEAIIYALTALQSQGNSTPSWGNVDVWVQHAMLPVGVVALVTAAQQTLKTVVSEMVVALLCGNTLVVRPHPCQPLLPVLLGDWLAQAGLPNGAYNVVQGDEGVSQALHAHPAVQAISYVLAPPAIDDAHLRQRQTMLAHNFIVVDEHMAIDKVWAAFETSATPRLGAPIWVVVGQTTEGLCDLWQQYLATQAPLVLPTQTVQQQCSEFLQAAVGAGADLVVDGSQTQLPAKGWMTGMSVVAGVMPEMGLHTQAPMPACVLVMPVPNLATAIDIINHTPNVGAANLFTESMTAMGCFKQALHQVEVISFNRVETVTSLNMPRGDIAHPWAVGGQHAARWQFYTRQQLITGAAI